MSTCGAPKCPAEWKYKCARCGRMVCEWHSASGPVQQYANNKAAVMALPVCMPGCDADYWSKGCLEEPVPEVEA